MIVCMCTYTIFKLFFYIFYITIFSFNTYLSHIEKFHLFPFDVYLLLYYVRIIFCNRFNCCICHYILPLPFIFTFLHFFLFYSLNPFVFIEIVLVELNFMELYWCRNYESDEESWVFSLQSVLSSVFIKIN